MKNYVLSVTYLRGQIWFPMTKAQNPSAHSRQCCESCFPNFFWFACTGKICCRNILRFREAKNVSKFVGAFTWGLETPVPSILLFLSVTWCGSFCVVGTLFPVSWSSYSARVWLGHALPAHLWTILFARQVEMFWSSEENR